MCDLHRQYLTQEVAVLAANALVNSQLDYWNSLFRGLSCFIQHKLNTLARTATNNRKYAHVTPIPKQLHWLPANYHCMFKTTTLLNFYTVVVLAILDHPRLTVAPTVP